MKIEQLSREDKIELLELLEEKEKRIYKESYFEFFKAAWHVLEPTKELVCAPFIKYLCDRLQFHVKHIIEEKKAATDLLIINIPPGMSKSSIVTKFLNPWIWTIYPTFRVMNSSYSSKLSFAHCVKSRDIIASPWYQNLFGNEFDLKADQNQKSEFGNNKTGLRMATSTGGAATGFHFDLWVTDDPLNPKQAASPRRIQSAIEFNDETVPSRIPDGLHVIVMQRLHQSDPTGHALKKIDPKFSDLFDPDYRIEHICLPAEQSKIVHPPEANDLYVDGLLDPVRLTQKKLNKKKVELGSYGYGGQYGQRPTPKGGGKIKESWFQYCHEKEVPRVTWDLWVDGAYTESTKNDPSGLMLAGFHERSNTLYIKHAHSAYMEMPEMLKFIGEYGKLHKLRGRSRIRFEPKASGKSFRQMVNAVSKMSAVEIKSHLVSEGKEARLQTASPKIEAGKVVLVQGTWNNSFVNQITGYPAADHDEYVDLIGYACDLYFDQGDDEMSVRVDN